MAIFRDYQVKLRVFCKLFLNGCSNRKLLLIDSGKMIPITNALIAEITQRLVTCLNPKGVLIFCTQASLQGTAFDLFAFNSFK